MMADWAYALSQGLGAGANTGANVMDQQIQNNYRMQAEQRAADIHLDMQQRMLAIQEAMKNRAAERFSTVVKDKMAEPVQADAQPVSETGITHASGEAMGLPASLQQSPAGVNKLVKLAQDTLANPAATDQQKEDARALMEQIGKQSDAQATLNTDAAKGKTRTRTVDEASQAALDQTLQTDAPAFAAGTGMLSTGYKQDIASRNLDIREKQITERLHAASDRTTMMGEIAKIRLETAQTVGASGGKLPSDAKMIEYLVEHGMDHKTAVDRVMGTGAGATKDPVAMATSLASSMISGGMVRVTKDDPPGTTVASKAMGMAMDQISAAEGRFRKPTSAWPAANSEPNPFASPGAKDPLGLFNK